MGGGRRIAAGANFSAEDILKEFMSGFGGAQQRGGRGAGVDPFGAAGGQGFAGGARQPQAKGEDTNATVAVSLEDAHKGGSVPRRLPNNKVGNVKLPEGVEDGQQIRLKGQGQASPWGGEPGDAIVTVKFERHPNYRRDGADLRD